MHFSTSKNTKSGMVVNMRHTTGGSVMLINKKRKMPLADGVTGGSIGANRIVGIIQSRMPEPPNASMNSVGGSGLMNFSKHVKLSGRSIQKKGEDANINFVY